MCLTLDCMYKFNGNLIINEIYSQFFTIKLNSQKSLVEIQVKSSYNSRNERKA